MSRTNPSEPSHSGAMLSRRGETERSQPVVMLRNVTKTYSKGGHKVTPLSNVDLDIYPGDFIALMGPSGSGKSTLLNLISGIDKPTAGRVVVHGEDITDWSEDDLAEWRTRAIGYIFQQFNLMPVLTAYENVELPLLLVPLTAAKRRSLTMTALDLVGLSDRASHYPRQLSGGQEQRVAIARSLATDPLVLLADEPTGNLDRDSALGVMDLFVELNQRYNKTIVMVTHDPHVAQRASTPLHLDKGELLEQAEIDARLAEESRLQATAAEAKTGSAESTVQLQPAEASQ